MKVIKITILILSLILLICSCNPDSVTENTGNSDKKVSVSFGGAKSVTAVVGPIDKQVLYWKYAARKLFVFDIENPVPVDFSGQTDTYDEDGAVFIHESDAGLEGTVDGFSTGTWDFLLFGYSRSGSEGNYTYHLVASGELKGKELTNTDVNMVIVPVLPVSDSSHGNGDLFVDGDNIVFDPVQSEMSEIGVTNRTIEVTRLSDDQAQTGSDGHYYVLPGLYKVKITYGLGDYTYAVTSVIATVYANMTTTVSGSATELTTFVSIDIPEQGE